MSTVGIGLMGFGRIGRNLFRILYQSQDLRLRAISDIADHKALEYLLRFDTILGPFPDEVSVKEGHLYVAGRQIPMLAEKEPGDVPWGDLGVDVVIEATAQKWSRGKLERHLERGAKWVILCAPPQDRRSAQTGSPDCLQRFMYRPLCRPDCQDPARSLRHSARVFEHRSCVYQSAAPGRCPLRG
jgi:glyceraldehyde-3-phosphate dehydrogenase/erythrose-4-phosphate dehydrogenase